MSNQNWLIAVLLIVVAGGAYAGHLAYTALRADIVEVGWRVGTVEESVVTLEPEAVTEASETLLATARALREEIAVIAATAEASATRSAETASVMAQTVSRLDALESQIGALQSGLSDLGAGLETLDSTLEERFSAMTPAPAPIAEPDPDLSPEEIAALEAVGVGAATDPEGAEPVAEAEPEAAFPTAPGELVLMTSDTTWMRVVSQSAGGLFEGLLEPGQEVRVSSDAQPLVTRLGNGGQVYAAVNGELRGPFGNAGTVLDLFAVDEDFVLSNLPVADPIRLTTETAAAAPVAATPTAEAIRPVPRPLN